MGLFSKTKPVEIKKTKADHKSALVSSAPKIEPAKASMKDLYDGSESKDTVTKGDGTVKKDRKYGAAYRLIVKPLITEKAANIGTQNKYVFAVAKNANKIEIAKAINEIYGIKPSSVNVLRVKGKDVRHGKILGRRSDWKKAIITLPAGKTINIYEGV